MSQTVGDLKIDHVTIAGRSLPALEQTFARLGLATDYGGPHSNGITHMSLLGFDDGSYIELISTVEPGQTDTVFWGKQIAENGGPCAWAVYVDDVAAEAQRLSRLGITVDGPHYYHRQRPDGQMVEWNLAFLGDKGAGATLPFIIKDITPRRLRVQPSASVGGSGNRPALLSGVAGVILGVRDLPAATSLFQQVYQWPPPAVRTDPAFGAKLAHFEATPVILAEPLPGHAWLADRLARFDDSPCAFLIGVPDLDAALDQFDLIQSESWFGRRAAWYNPDRLDGHKLGMIEQPATS